MDSQLELPHTLDPPLAPDVVMGRLALWAESGLPLPVMLRTLAEELGGRSGGALRALAEQVERGDSLEQAFSATQRKFPPRLRRQLAVAAESGDLAALLPALAALRESSSGVASQLASILAYPAVMLAAVLAIAVLFSLFIVPSFSSIYDDFELDLPAATNAMVVVSQWLPAATTALAGLAAGLFLLSYWSPAALVLHRIAAAAPLVGKVWVSHGHQKLTHIMAACTGAGMTAAGALRAAAAGLDDRYLAAETLRAAQRCEAGLPMSAAFAESPGFERPLCAHVAWGETHSVLPAAFAEASEFYLQQSHRLLTLLRRVAPAITLVLVIVIVFFTVAALFLPLLGLVQSLS